MLNVRTAARDDSGFTLVELLLAIVVMGVIAAPLAGVLIAFLKNSDATSRRMNESHDAQIAAAYFAQDVQAMGVHDYSDATKLDKPLVQSVETSAASSKYQCGTAPLSNVLVRIAWDDWGGVAPGASAPDQIRVAYVRTGTELHRAVCKNNSTVLTDTVVAHNVVAASVSCTTASGGTGCTGGSTDVPINLALKLDLRDPKSTVTYPVTLTGQRRQT
ncbi:type II secretion system protein J [Geodermatophilus sp. SYSU D01062]